MTPRTSRLHTISRAAHVAGLFALVVGIAVTIVGSSAAQESESGVVVKKLTPKKKEKTPIEIFTLHGSLKRSDPTDKVRGGCFSQVITRNLVVGKTYVVELNQSAGTSWDPYLRLENSGGTQLMQDDDSGGGLNSRMVFSPSVSEDYKIIITTCSSGQIGDFELKITPLAPGVVIPGIGMPLSHNLPVEYGDIMVIPEPPLAAGMNESLLRFGYIEYRFTIENHSGATPHRVELQLPGQTGFSGYRDDRYISAMRRTVDVGPQASVQISLWQPAVPLGGAHGARVVIDGREMEIGLPCQLLASRGDHGRHWGVATPTIAGSGNIPILTTGDSVTVASNMTFAAARARARIEDPKGAAPVHMPFQFHSPGQSIGNWSSSWLAYTPFAGIALTGASLDSAPPSVRAAIFQYVECGGGLLLLDAAKLPPGWESTRQTEKGMTRYSPGFGRCIVVNQPDPTDEPNTGKAITEAWQDSFKAFHQATNPTDANRQFSVVESAGIPVRGLFTFMFLFVLIIGPINVFWLARINRRIWLLWTVPVFSLLTSVLMFGYMAVTEGWNAHVRVEGITVLDENTQRAASIGWLGLYSPMTPGGGLHFSSQTELTPHIERNSGHMHRFGRRGDGQPMTIDWTHDQHLDAGWMSAKVPLHFLTRRNEKRFERLLIRVENGEVVAVNGLKGDIASLWFADADGKIWTATDVAAGAEVKLSRDADKVTAETTDDPLARGFGGSWLTLAARMKLAPEQFLRPNGYIAVLNNAPFLETGLDQTQSVAASSIIVGIRKTD